MACTTASTSPGGERVPEVVRLPRGLWGDLDVAAARQGITRDWLIEVVLKAAYDGDLDTAIPEGER